MSNMTSLENVLATALAKVTNVDIPAIIEAAQACCMGGCAPTVAESKVEVVVTPAPKAEKAPRTKKEVVDTLVKAIEPVVQECKPEPLPQGGMISDEAKAAFVDPVVTKEPPPGIDLSGLFVGTGADKKVVKDVFLAAVEKAKNVATLAALNATCDCGFATGDYTDNEMEVLRRKLKRWGAAQE